MFAWFYYSDSLNAHINSDHLFAAGLELKAGCGSAHVCVCVQLGLFYLSIRDATSDVICSAELIETSIQAAAVDIVHAEKATVLSPATIVWECNEFYVAAAAAGREIHFSPPSPTLSPLSLCRTSPPILQFINSHFMCQSAVGE